MPADCALLYLFDFDHERLCMEQGQREIKLARVDGEIYLSIDVDSDLTIKLDQEVLVKIKQVLDSDRDLTVEI